MTQTTKQRNVKNNGMTDPTCIVPTVTSGCQQGAMVDENTVTTPANQPHTVTSEKQRNGTPTSTKRHTTVTATVKNCEHCAAEFQTTRPKQSKYCNAVCRRNAWLDRNPDKAKALAESDKARLRQWYIDNGMEWKDEH